MQFNDSLQLRMKVSTILVALIVVLSEMHSSNAFSTHIDPDIFATGDCGKSHFTASPTGRLSHNVYDKVGNIMLHVDYRVNWGGNTNTLYLNTYKGDWGTPQLVTGIASTPGTVVELLVCARENDFSITFNKKQVATYNYRIPGAVVTRFEYQNNGYDSTVMELCIVYSS